MESLEGWLQRKYLEWQQENGLASVKAFAKFLGVTYTTLLTVFNGDRETTSMSTAYQIGERLGDFSILELLGYPVPDAPLVGFTPEQREYVLDFLSRVKTALGGLPPNEQDAKLKEMLDSEGWVESVSD